ncbi:MAG: hypothetical protein GEU97_21175 [Actinophytocola sp.]|nr:hypothetical protein [Actinophytocola sp.]
MFYATPVWNRFLGDVKCRSLGHWSDVGITLRSSGALFTAQELFLSAVTIGVSYSKAAGRRRQRGDDAAADRRHDWLAGIVALSSACRLTPGRVCGDPG